MRAQIDYTQYVWASSLVHSYYYYNVDHDCWFWEKITSESQGMSNIHRHEWWDTTILCPYQFHQQQG